MWYQVICKLNNIGLCCSMHDPGVFFLVIPNMFILVVIHINNCLIVTKSHDTMLTFKDQLRCCFEISDLGEACWLLGYEVRMIVLLKCLPCPNMPSLTPYLPTSA